VLSAVLLWPITRTGYLLGHDMVFTSRQSLDLASIGVSSASPRAVPLDALVALSERVLDGAVVGRLALLAPLIAVGAGAACLLGSRLVAARLAACTVAIWNPFVVERLALGQWALVWAYAALPWLILAMARLRGRSARFGIAVALAAASITPSGGLIAGATAIAMALGLRRGPRELAATGALALVLQLPWLIPALVSPAAATSDPAAVAAFSARAEHSGGVLLTLFGGGGIWDADVAPGSRGGALGWLALAVLAAVAVFGVRRLAALVGNRLVGTLAAVSGVGLLLAVLPSVPGGDAVVRAALADVPGAGLLRDAQKWVLPLVLFEAVLAGAAVEYLAERIRGAAWRPLLIVVSMTLPVIVLPDAAATLRRTLDPVHYPPDWAAVARRLGGGQAAVLPFASYRSFPWAPGRSVLDPAPRAFRGGIVVDDRLAVSGHLLQGEDPRARAVAGALGAGTELPQRLARLGITWVIVERDTPGAVPDLSGLHEAYPGHSISLYRVPGPISTRRNSAVQVTAVLVGDALAVLALLALAVRAAVGRTGRRHQPTGDQGPPAGTGPQL
jgi:hypothetical protein